MVSSYRIALLQNKTVGWIYYLTISTKRTVLLIPLRVGEDFYVYRRILFARYTIRDRGKLKTTEQVVLIVIDFLLWNFELKKIKTKTKQTDDRLQESIIDFRNSTFFQVLEI